MVRRIWKRSVKNWCAYFINENGIQKSAPKGTSSVHLNSLENQWRSRHYGIIIRRKKRHLVPFLLISSPDSQHTDRRIANGKGRGRCESIGNTPSSLDVLPTKAWVMLKAKWEETLQMTTDWGFKWAQCELDQMNETCPKALHLFRCH